MDKFTKLKRVDKKNINVEIPKYNGKDINIIEYKEWDIINGKDKVAILPYLKDDGYILLRYENIPTYHYKYKDEQEYKNVFNFLSIIKGDIEQGENPTQSIRRVLVNDCGIILSNNYPITIDKKLFKDEKNTGQYYISLLELNYNDFKQGQLNKSIKDQNVVKISLGDIDDIKIFDLITDYLLLQLKFDYNIK